MISKYRFSSQSVMCLRNSRSSHSRVAAKCSTKASPNSPRAAFDFFSRCAASNSVAGRPCFAACFLS